MEREYGKKYNNENNNNKNSFVDGLWVFGHRDYI